MEFIFETMYNQKWISVMAEALRKTIFKEESYISETDIGKTEIYY